MKTLYNKYSKSIWHFIKFVCVGALNFLVDYGVLSLLNVVLGWPLVISNVISYTCGVVNSFIFNRFWTFKMKVKFFSKYTVTRTPRGGGKPRTARVWFLSADFIKFVFVNLVSLGVNTLAVYILGEMYGLSNLWAKLIATVFSFIVNFAGNKLLVFREPASAVQHKE